MERRMMSHEIRREAGHSHLFFNAQPDYISHAFQAR
jgi:hypothetical protein